MDIFTKTEGLILLILLIAHIFADFFFQSKKMIDRKETNEIKAHILHAIIVLLTSSIVFLFLTISKEFNFLRFTAAILTISILHLIFDFVKCKISSSEIETKRFLFFIDQICHILVIVISWTIAIDKINPLLNFGLNFLSNFNYMLVFLAYLFCTKPVGIIISKILEKFFPVEKETDKIIEINTIKGTGSYIGIFERLIILTLVLLNQYTAIAFLATAKSILRIDNKNANEDNLFNNTYVLLGTLMSFAIAFIVGLICNFVLIKSNSITLPELFRIIK